MDALGSIDTLAVVVAIATVVTAVRSSIAGFGAALILGPILAIAYGPADAVVTMLSVGLVSSVIGVAADLRDPARPRPAMRDAGLILFGAVLAAAPVAVVLSRLPLKPALAGLGLAVLLSTYALWRRLRIPGVQRPIAAVTTGVVCMIGSALAGVGGPPIVLFGLSKGWDPRVARSTQQVFFAALNVLTLGFTFASGRDGSIHWPLLVIMFVASIAAIPLRRRIGGHQLRVVLIAMSGFGGAATLVRAVLLP